MGADTVASGAESVAIGSAVSATGDGSMALGSALSASTNGTIMIGDRSTVVPLLTFAPNEFLVRAAGGTGIYSNKTLTAGVELRPGAGGWLSVSDADLKEHFRDLDGDALLVKIARMPIREWNYKAQDAAIRHVGPTAQDFHAAFGLGEDPLRIGTIDADGIALRAIQALEARTRRENQDLAAQNQQLTRENADLRARVERLEQRFDKR